jgi:C4-dicarboxylate-binding protein DctP
MNKIKQSGRVKIHELTDDERQAFMNSLSTVNNKWGNKMDSEILQKAKEANQ